MAVLEDQKVAYREAGALSFLAFNITTHCRIYIFMKSNSTKHALATSLIVIVAMILAAGCATPNLGPFADATASMSAAGKRAGDLSLALLATQTIKSNAGTFRPGDTNHPSVQFEQSWKLRRKALDDIEAYTASLGALGDASSNSKSNVTQVVSALQELASNVPGIGSGVTAAGDLLITIGRTIIEVKAYRDMAKLVKAAHPLVKEVVAALEKDLGDLQILFESLMRAELRRLKNKAEAPQKYYDKLRGELDTLRTAAGELAGDTVNGNKIIRLDQLIAGVESEVSALDKEIAAQKLAMEDGLHFFEQAKETLSTWLESHGQLHAALSEKQLPNLALLISRAQELKAAADNLRKPQSP